jgi:hypothetical protein
LDQNPESPLASEPSNHSPSFLSTARWPEKAVRRSHGGMVLSVLLFRALLHGGPIALVKKN